MKKLLVASFTKEALQEASCCQSVASSALDWLQTELERMVLYVAEHGVKTPGGKLQAPKTAYPVAQGPTAGGSKDFPEKACWRAKEWRGMSEADKTLHLTELFAAWFALNTGEKLETLHELYITPVDSAGSPADAPPEEEEHEEPKTKVVESRPRGRGHRDDMSAL